MSKNKDFNFSPSINGGIPYELFNESFSSQCFFSNKTWLFSPKPFPINTEQYNFILNLGKACFEFYKSLELLYERSLNNKNILRNGNLHASWVAEYLNRGKPDALLRCSSNSFNKGEIPSILRPDLLLTDEGFALTEFDSVPGGIGLTAFLNKFYSQNGINSNLNVIGSPKAGECMVDAFYRVLSAKKPQIDSPLIVIIVSDEAKTYKPEMEWISKELRSKGKRVYTSDPDSVIISNGSICLNLNGVIHPIDIIYRFWELFDMDNISNSNYFLDVKNRSKLIITPPIKPFQEEKLAMALFHHRIIDSFWREQISRQSYHLLKKIIPMTWVVDPVDLPPNAFIDAPLVNGCHIRSWKELANAGKKDRNLILKISGFHETAWGARSVVLGNDCSSSDWEDALDKALNMASESPFILQIYKKPMRVTHPVYSEEGSILKMDGRLRLCPYFFVNPYKGIVDLRGILATLCPSDKKIIHGMKDATLIPCKIVD